MKKILSTLVIGILLLLTSCADHETPDPIITQYRLVFLYGDDCTQIYTYDKNGLIGEWSYVDTKTDSNLCKSTYQYAEDGSFIVISSEEDRGGGQKWLFDETLYLNPDGTAKTASGTVVLDFVDELITDVKKNYVTEFQYDGAGRLIRIQIEEKTDGALESAKPLDWNVQLVWDDDKLMEYAENYASGRSIARRNFSYYDGLSVDYPIFMQTPMLRHYYTPLLYQGVLGYQSPCLVKSIGYTDNDVTYTDKFSYTFSTSSTSTRVEEAVKLVDDREIKYVVGWENK